jgi:glutathione peroxidase
MSDKSIYQFSVQQLNGETVSLERYRNKVLLIVNTASGCGFTPQLKDLELLRKEFEDQDFEILAFPSNDFGNQEPLEGAAITRFCKINFHTRFDIFDKIHVKGRKAHPLYRFLSNKKQNGRVGSTPRWNFHKYLVNKNGEVADYFYSFTKPSSIKIKRRIRSLLASLPLFV